MLPSLHRLPLKAACLSLSYDDDLLSDPMLAYVPHINDLVEMCSYLAKVCTLTKSSKARCDEFVDWNAFVQSIYRLVPRMRVIFPQNADETDRDYFNRVCRMINATENFDGFRNTDRYSLMMIMYAAGQYTATERLLRDPDLLPGPLENKREKAIGTLMRLGNIQGAFALVDIAQRLGITIAQSDINFAYWTSIWNDTAPFGTIKRLQTSTKAILNGDMNDMLFQTWKHSIRRNGAAHIQTMLRSLSVEDKAEKLMLLTNLAQRVQTIQYADQMLSPTEILAVV